MASGKKNYFRHSFFARNDIKLKLLRDEIGIGFYFYYFSLLELCGEESSDELKDEYVFHESTIRSLWSVNLKKSERIACVMHSVRLLEFKKRQKTFSFRIPNLSKYMGRYTSKFPSNTSNKRKEKERKGKKRKEKNKSIFDLSDIEKIYNNYPLQKGKTEGIKKLHGTIKTQDEYDNIMQAVKRYKYSCNGTEPKYIKHFSSWVNGECWNDEMPDTKAEWEDKMLAILGVTDVPE